MISPGPVLGIEGTAWNLSASLFEHDCLALESRPYKPLQGGIHPREAAQHHAAELKPLISSLLSHPEQISGVAFSQGPGLGPCLRTVATAARALSVALGVPLIGVNHCVAHIEIGRFETGCHDPIVLYASGANTQVIGYLKKRYRIFGETLDIGIGNALDKFARSRDLPHPGGPLLERLAEEGTYFDLPYTVKGMDLAFSGIVSAAQESGRSLPDTAHSLQETCFAMCVEVTERALALSGKDEVLLVGGVGANRRLQQMLHQMCQDRGAEFFVPDKRYLGDNGAMIAYTGRLMLESGLTTSIENSRVNPSFRSDEVEVRWREEPEESALTHGGMRWQGAEATVTCSQGTASKQRHPKRYRVRDLDLRLIGERTRAEARLIGAARRGGVRTPLIRDITFDTIAMEYVEGRPLSQSLTPENLYLTGLTLGRLHTAGIIHGDLTTSNILITDSQVVLIDFGLSQTSSELEQRGVDIRVLLQTLASTAPEREPELRSAFMRGYSETCELAHQVFEREREIAQRGRYL